MREALKDGRGAVAAPPDLVDGGSPPPATGPGDDPAGGPRTDGGTGPSVRGYIRGSGLLLGGRGVSILLNLAVQVLTVRYLSKSDYGAFAYALGVASIGSSTVLMGLGKTIPRFIPIYQERGDYARVFGTMALAAGTVWGLGLSLMVLLFGVRGLLLDSVVPDPLTLSLLLILIALAPLNAFDHLLQNVVAIFARPRAIFFRRQVLGPGLKLMAILLVIAVAGDVYLLAYGYLVGGALGIWLYLSVLRREWRRQGLFAHLDPRRLRMPAREIFGFSVPMITAELPVLLRGSAVVLLLGYFQTTDAVAEYRAVYPVARLNLVVYQAFGFLFVPIASRMFARADAAGLNDLYWRTSALIVVLTFPVFAATTAVAAPLTVLMFGSTYASAALVLAVLAVGEYVNAALGFNADTLRVYGRVRYAVLSNIATAIAFLVLAALLIPRYGALGAAVAASGSALVHMACNHAGLWIAGTGIRLPDRRFLAVSLAAAGLVGGVLAAQWVLRPSLLGGLALSGLASLVLLRITRRVVRIEESFPELLRVPLLRRVLT
jgi:O-antigen/teichoic acid export membrane protein